MKRLLIAISLILIGVYGVIRITPLPVLASFVGGPLPDYGWWNTVGFLAAAIAAGTGMMQIILWIDRGRAFPELANKEDKPDLPSTPNQ